MANTRILYNYALKTTDPNLNNKDYFPNNKSAEL